MEKDPTGFLIQASCKALQLEAGWMGNIFEIPETYTGLRTPNRIVDQKYVAYLPSLSN